jgi:cold shock CspA family protein
MSTNVLDDCRIKWFDRNKGYGFLVAPRMDDIFLHAAVLERCRVYMLPKNCSLKVEVAAGEQGLRVLRIISITAPQQ